MRTTVFFQRQVGWCLHVSCIVLPVITAMLLSLIIISPPTFPALSLFSLTSSVKTNYSSYDPTYNIIWSGLGTTPFYILLGPGGGCMKFDHDEMICERTLTFRPSSTYLHLPPDETLTSKFPDNTNWLLMHHITLGTMVSAITVFWLGPFLPGTYVLSTFIMFLAFLFTFFLLFIGDAIGVVVLSNRLKDCIPETKVQVTYGFILELILNFLSSISFLILGSIAWKIDTSGPPREDVELQPPRDSSKSEDRS